MIRRIDSAFTPVPDRTIAFAACKAKFGAFPPQTGSSPGVVTQVPLSGALAAVRTPRRAEDATAE